METMRLQLPPRGLESSLAPVSPGPTSQPPGRAPTSGRWVSTSENGNERPYPDLTCSSAPQVPWKPDAASRPNLRGALGGHEPHTDRGHSVTARLIPSGKMSARVWAAHWVCLVSGWNRASRGGSVSQTVSQGFASGLGL